MGNHTTFSFYDTIKRQRLPFSTNFSIGRTDATITFPNDTMMSKKHLAVYVSGNQVWIEDLNSTNKTYINGEPIPPNQKTLINPNDTIQIGEQKFTFVAPSSIQARLSSRNKTKTMSKTTGAAFLVILSLGIIYFSELLSASMSPLLRMIMLSISSILIFISANYFLARQRPFLKRGAYYFGIIIPLLLLYVHFANQRLQIEDINGLLRTKGNCPNMITQLKSIWGSIVSSPELRYSTAQIEDACRMIKAGNEFRRDRTALCPESNNRPTLPCFQRILSRMSSEAPLTMTGQILMIGLGPAILVLNATKMRDTRNAPLSKIERANMHLSLLDFLISVLENKKNWLKFNDFINPNQSNDRYVKMAKVDGLLERYFIQNTVSSIIDMTNKYVSKYSNGRELAFSGDYHDEKYQSMIRRLDELKRITNYPDASLEEDAKLYEKELKKYKHLF